MTIHEPGLEDLLHRNAERLTFTTDMDELLDGARLLFVCVDTPPTYSGDADLSRVRAVVQELPEDSDHVLIMKSTVPAGTGESIRRDMPGLAYVSCPEFLKEGTAVDGLHAPRPGRGRRRPRRRGGGRRGRRRSTEPLGGEILRTDVASAEMIKLASNAFLATKISFINEIANVCEEVGADVGQVAKGMGLDERIGSSFLRAGIGYGGSVLPRFGDGAGAPRGDAEAADLRAALGVDRWRCETWSSLRDLCVWSWVPGEGEPEWMPVSVLTKRDYDGEMIELRTKMGRKLRVTADHPIVVGDGKDEEVLTTVRADEVTTGDWMPLAGAGLDSYSAAVLSTVGVVEDVDAGGRGDSPPRGAGDRGPAGAAGRRAGIDPGPSTWAGGEDGRHRSQRRPADDEAQRRRWTWSAPAMGTARSGTYVPERLEDE